MGHWITAHNNSECHGEDLALLNRSAGNPLNSLIYNALDANRFNCGSSGCGETAYFSIEQLKQALEVIPQGDSFEPEREFLQDCILYGDDGVWINFI